MNNSTHNNATHKNTAHIIFIILDDSEPAVYRGEMTEWGVLTENLGAVATDLLIALLEEESIIIVNSSVVNYLMRYLNEVSQNPLGLKPLKKINPQNWTKKKISDYLYILLPKKYISVHEPLRYKELKAHTLNVLDEQELALGIKFKSLKDINDSEFMQPKYHRVNYPLKETVEEIELSQSTVTFTQKLSWISNHVIENLDKIFISKKKYKNFSHLIPQSIIIATGHGSSYYSISQQIQLLEQYGRQAQSAIKHLKNQKSLGKTAYSGGSLAGFNSKDFGAFVSFLSVNCSVQFLFFNTCYGSEININEALGKQVIPFPLISGALTSGTSFNHIETESSSSTYNRSDEIIHLIKPAFKRFSEVLATHEVQSDEVLFKALENIYTSAQKVDTSYNNVLSIKRPGEQWKVMKRPHIITFDEAFLEQQKGESCINGSLLFDNKVIKSTPNPNFILLKTPKIPYALILCRQHVIDLPAFISILPGDALHHFVKIDAQTFSLAAFFNAFFKIPDLKENKTFVINDLIVKNNIKSILQSTQELVHLKNVVIMNEVDTSGDTAKVKKSIFFEYNNNAWYITTTGDNAPLLQCIQKTTAPEKIKQLLRQLQGEATRSEALENQDVLKEIDFLEEQYKNTRTVFDDAFIVLYAVFCS